MKKLIATLVTGFLIAGVAFAQRADEAAPAVRFQAIDIYIDSRDQPLAAYQLEVTADRNVVKIAGIEGGEHPAFREAPYYDPRAIQRERVVIAAFKTGSADNLPKGRTRIATVHVQITGEARPDFNVHLSTAATLQGEKVSATAEARERAAD